MPRCHVTPNSLLQQHEAKKKPQGRKLKKSNAYTVILTHEAKVLSTTSSSTTTTTKSPHCLASSRRNNALSISLLVKTTRDAIRLELLDKGS